MKSFRKPPGVHAGSMADIAFLLLIFFLLSTKIPNDKGIVRKLPPPCKSLPCGGVITEKNILRIYINRDGEIMVEEKITDLSKLRATVKDFIGNNGDGSCDYCLGPGLVDSSDNPTVAVISLSAHRNTKYKNYISVQNEVSAAYSELRNNYLIDHLQLKADELSENALQDSRQAYPMIISEAEIE